MATRKTSQAQQETAASPAHPFMSLPGMEMWRSMMESQNQRFEQMLAEMARLETERHERAVSSLDDVTKLIRSGLDYQAQLTAQWRELSLEATRKTVAMVQSSQA